MSKQAPNFIRPTAEEWRDLGYHPMVAEALEAHEMTLPQVAHLSSEELIDLALSYEGIIGYTASIISLVKEPCS